MHLAMLSLLEYYSGHAITVDAVYVNEHSVINTVRDVPAFNGPMAILHKPSPCLLPNPATACFKVRRNWCGHRSPLRCIRRAAGGGPICRANAGKRRRNDVFSNTTCS